MPEPFPIGEWSEHRVRTDCHIQVRANFYSVPYKLVGKVVVVRVDAKSITVYNDFGIVARHERRMGRGETVTDRSHYPEHKRKASQERFTAKEWTVSVALAREPRPFMPASCVHAITCTATVTVRCSSSLNALRQKT